MSIKGSGTTPTDLSDFSGPILPASPITFAPNETSRTITVTVAGDAAFEPDEQFAISLYAPDANASIATATAVGTILNDDSRLSIAPAGARRAEGQSGTTGFTFVVTRNGPATLAASAKWTVSGQGPNGASAADFAGGVLPSGSVNLAAGQSSATITVPVAGDTLAEATETFAVALSVPSAGASIAGGPAVGTILDDDAGAVISIESMDPGPNIGRLEGFGTAVYPFLLGREGLNTGTQVVTWQITGEVDSFDFAELSGQVTFTAGSTGPIQILPRMVGFDEVEPNERFTVTISTASAGAVIGQASADGIILNDDAELSLVPGAAQQKEGTGGTTGYAFTVQRRGWTELNGHRANWTIAGSGPNKADAQDFAATKGEVVFLPGQTEATILVPVMADAMVEPDEGFLLTLSDPVTIAYPDGMTPAPGAPTLGSVRIATFQTGGTILNDDTAGSATMSTSFSIAATNAMRREGNAGTTPYTFTVARSGDASQAQSLAWAVGAPGDGSETRLAGNAVINRQAEDGADGILFFDRNAAPITPGTADRWRVFTHGAGGQVKLLVYKDVGATWEFVGASPLETVTKDGLNEFVLPTGIPVGPDSVVALWYPPGSFTKVAWDTFGTTMNNDQWPSNPITAADLASLYMGTIPDLQATPSYDGSNWSGNPRTYSVALFGDDLPEPGDFAGGALPSGTVSFAPGETSRTITVGIAGDTLAEASERFGVTLSGAPAGATIATATANGLILDDDTPLLKNGGFEFGDFSNWTLNFTPPDNAAVIMDNKAPTASVATWDLKADWSDSKNPNGPWSYGGSNGAVTTFQANYYPQYFGNGQGAWARGNSVPEGANPSWMKLTGLANTASQIVGKVGDMISAPAIPSDQPASVVRWTSPGAYTVTISGATWHAHVGGNATQNWTLALNGVALQSGSLPDWQSNGRNNPDLIQASNVVVKAGDVISMSFAAVTDANWVGLSLTITSPFTRVNEGRYAVNFSYANVPATATLAQSFATIPGQSYRVAYDFGTIGAIDRSPSLLATVLGSNGATELGKHASSRQNAGDEPTPPTWSRDAFVFVADGTTATLRFTDTTNPSFASDALLDNVVVELLDATSLALAPGMDSGASASDGITNIAAPTFTGGTAPGATVTLLDGATPVGTGKADAAGLWSITSATLSDKQHSLTAIAKDAGGATIGISAALLVRIDTTAPSAPAGLALFLGSDSGAPGDGVTENATQVINGTGEAGATVTLFAGGVAQGTAQVDDKGQWSFAASLGIGKHSLTAAATDPAGNTGPASTPLLLSVVGPSQASIAALNASRAEGHAGTTGFTFTVSRSNDISEGVTVKWAVTGSGASPAGASDFAGGAYPSGTVTFAAGEASQTVTVNVAGEGAVEADEGFTVTLSSPGFPLTLGTATATGTILNDDAAVAIAAASATKPEGNSGITAFTFNVTRTGSTAGIGTVAWSVAGSGGNPASAADFPGGALPAGILTFAAGQASQTVTVNVAGDATVEPDEGFTVTLANPSPGLALGTETASGTIQNDDTAPASSVSIAPLAAERAEGSGGTTAFTFTVSRSGATATPGTVDWSVTGADMEDLAAADELDFATLSGTLSFAAGEVSRVLTIPVRADTLVEGSEAFLVALANPTGGLTLETEVALGVIDDDDTGFAIAAAGGPKAEGTGGTTPYTFTVTRSGDSSASQTVAWKAAGAAGGGTVPANAADFDGGSFPGGTLTFAPGETARDITVAVAADSKVELNERFAVLLSAPSGGATLGRAAATSVILNDDTPPRLSVAAVAASTPEGNSGTTIVSFMVTRSGDASVPVSASWSVSGVSDPGVAPAAGSDFAGGVFPSGTVSFATGETVRSIAVAVQGDTAVEGDERFALTLSAPGGGATLETATALATITNDDAAGTGTLSIARLRAARAEGGNGTTPFTFTVTRTGITSGPASANWAVTGGSLAGTVATNAADFAGGVLPSGKVSFGAGETSRTVTVAVAGDATVELNESFNVVLSSPATGVTLGTASASGLVYNDDSPGTGALSITRATAGQAEGAAGSTAFQFTVTRTGDSSGTASADWSVAGGGITNTVAANGADFAAGLLPSGRVNFGAGQTVQTVTVLVAADTAQELNDSFTVSLSGLQSGVAMGASATASAVILNDDYASTAANQTLTGTTLADTFLLGGGLDTVTGAGGLDRFLFQPAALGAAAGNAVTLQDLNRVLGETLDLSAIDAIAGTFGNDAFAFIGNAAFSGTPGELRWQDLGTQRVIQGNVDTDLTPDLTIYVKAAGPVDAAWFVL